MRMVVGDGRVVVTSELRWVVNDVVLDNGRTSNPFRTDLTGTVQVSNPAFKEYLVDL
jgi:hypothetical protein